MADTQGMNDGYEVMTPDPAVSADLQARQQQDLHQARREHNRQALVNARNALIYNIREILHHTQDVHTLSDAQKQILQEGKSSAVANLTLLYIEKGTMRYIDPENSNEMVPIPFKEIIDGITEFDEFLQKVEYTLTQNCRHGFVYKMLGVKRSDERGSARYVVGMQINQK